MSQVLPSALKGVGLWDGNGGARGEAGGPSPEVKITRLHSLLEQPLAVCGGWSRNLNLIYF